jgi:Pseudomonas avirulence D protein (AvrD)
MTLNFYQNIDDFLGLRTGRYFGDGYLKTHQKIRDFNISGGLDCMNLTCVGRVDVPELWSKKGGDIQKPHLSTIDVIELALECLRLLREAQKGSPVLATDFLRELRITAGNTPVEDGLNAISIAGRVSRGADMQEQMELQIANMTVTMFLSPLGETASRSLEYCRKPVQLNNVMFNKDDVVLPYGVVDTVVQSYGAIETDQMNESQSLAWSVASAFACSLQLGQLLLYKLDGVDRATSNTLWMKRTTISLSGPLPLVGSMQPIHTRLSNVRRYTKADGDWRRADVTSSLCNMLLVCSVTHRLPAAQMLQ